MAEAVGLSASIITVAGVGLTLAQKLYDYGDGISSSSKRSREISSYVRSTAVAIEEVGNIFGAEDTATRKLISQNAIDTVQDVVEQCSTVFEQLREALENAKDGNGGLGRLLFPLRESRLVLLQSNLERLKSTLQCLMQVIIYARLKAEPSQDINDTSQRRLIQELITLRQQAATTYERNKTEAGVVDVEEDGIVVTASSSRIGPQLSNQEERRNNQAKPEKEDGNDEDSMSDGNKIDSSDSQVRSIALRPNNRDDDAHDFPRDEVSLDRKPADNCKKPRKDSLFVTPRVIATAASSISIAENTAKEGAVASQEQTQERTRRFRIRDFDGRERDSNDFPAFARMFGDALKFVCCCPCIYLLREPMIDGKKQSIGEANPNASASGTGLSATVKPTPYTPSSGRQIMFLRAADSGSRLREEIPTTKVRLSDTTTRARFDDSGFKHGKALDFPEPPGEEHRNRRSPQLRTRYISESWGTECPGWVSPGDFSTRSADSSVSLENTTSADGVDDLLHRWTNLYQEPTMGM